MYSQCGHADEVQKNSPRRSLSHLSRLMSSCQQWREQDAQIRMAITRQSQCGPVVSRGHTVELIPAVSGGRAGSLSLYHHVGTGILSTPFPPSPGHILKHDLSLESHTDREESATSWCDVYFRDICGHGSNLSPSLMQRMKPPLSRAFILWALTSPPAAGLFAGLAVSSEVSGSFVFRCCQT